MLKAIIIDSSAVARGLLNTVLTSGSYDVCGQAGSAAQCRTLLIKHQPHLLCIAREQMDEDSSLVREIRANWPKTLIFMVSGGIDALTLQTALASGVNGFIVKPFNADTVLKTIRNAVLAMIKKQRQALAAAPGASAPNPGSGEAA